MALSNNPGYIDGNKVYPNDMESHINVNNTGASIKITGFFIFLLDIIHKKGINSPLTI